MKTIRLFSILSVVAALWLGFIASPASAGPMTTDFFVWLVDRADLEPTSGLSDKAEKGQFVFTALQQEAERSQAPLRAFLDQQGVVYQSFYIVNAILVHRGPPALIQSLAARPEVAGITIDPYLQIPKPLYGASQVDLSASIEPNLTFINADDAWALGVTGQGSVLAAIDTGIQWDHPALIEHYRGWDGAVADHNYNWWDATGSYPNAPSDGNGHGTMVTGIMVGGEGTLYQIGVAPGAKTIHCKAFTDYGSGTLSDILECFQWILTPWDLNAGTPRPDLAPDAVTNSWGGAGGYPGYELAIDALQAAGILVEAATGGGGPGCASLGSPGDYAQLMSTGAVDQTGGVLPGTLAYFSARGPSLLDPLAFIPDVVAPGVNIRSSYPGDDYDVWSGTSLAGPHVTGLVGLMWSINPILRGNIPDTVQIIDDTAVPLTGQTGSQCGGDYITGPNNDWGYGTIDALAAVEQALGYGNLGTLQGEVTDVDAQLRLEGAGIQAFGVQEWLTATNSLGLYSLVVPSGTYTVSASLEGYYTEIITGVMVISGEVTAQDFSLLHVPVTISGTITDANTNLPLAAAIDVTGGLITSTLSDPSTGFYSFTLAAQRTYTLTAQAIGYGIVLTTTGILSSDYKQDFALPAGKLSAAPPNLELELISGQSLTLPITLTNLGGWSVTVEFSPTAGWLSISPSSGTLPISGTLILEASIKSASMISPGVYTTTIILINDTPYGPVNLPVRLMVNPRYDLFLPFMVYPAGLAASSHP